MKMVNTKVTRMIIERDEVIRARREALDRMKRAEPSARRAVHSEFFQPLNTRLVELNRELGI
jgi:hypothetical protein